MTPNAIEYSAEKGFRDISIPWRDDEQDSEWLARIGLHGNAEVCDGSDEPYLGPRMRIYLQARDCEWFAALEIDDGNRTDHIFVRSRADLLQLRIALAPLRSAGLEKQIETLAIGARHVFRHLYGHSMEFGCRICDPDGWAARQQKTKPLISEPAR